MPREALPGDFRDRLVRDCPDAVIYADARGVIRFWNGAATRIFGYGDAEAVGARLDLIIPEWLRGRHCQGYGEVMQGRASRYGEGALLAVPARHKDEEVRALRRELAALKAQAGPASPGA